MILEMKKKQGTMFLLNFEKRAFCFEISGHSCQKIIKIRSCRASTMPMLNYISFTVYKYSTIPKLNATLNILSMEMVLDLNTAQLFMYKFSIGETSKIFFSVVLKKG